ncbi:hypothetical protein AYO38_08005 [bacterium SCGC AG-212-C10]|nr:hypothetical protein AYO38_08005 [bacterium SCGC AG-212-C10]
MRIVIRSGEDSGHQFPVDREMTVGRAPDNAIVLVDADVSGHHAAVRPAPGGIEVVDTGSSNGTFVNGVRISAATLVRPGDDLLFAKTLAGVQGDETMVGEAPGAPNTLVVRAGANAGRSVQLHEGQDVYIGRDAGLGLTLSDSRVSGRHARVRLSGGTLTVEDLKSANGTLVNGKPLTGAMTANDGAEIQVGETVLVYYRDGARGGGYMPIPTIIGGVAPTTTTTIINNTTGGRSKKTTVALLGIGVIAIGAAAAAVAALLLSGGSGRKDEDIPTLVAMAKPETLQIVNLYNNGDAIGGSGSVIDAEDGLVLTNNHVATGGELLVLNELIGKKAVPAEMVAAAPCDDLAVIKITKSSDRKKLEQVEFGDADDLKQGQLVVALGYPNSAESGAGDRLDSLSATSGIISKVATTYNVPGSDVPELTNAIQHQAAVNHGNSGGPLFDTKGRQVGVNTAIFITDTGERYEGENYAVSVARVQELLPKLKKGQSIKWVGATLDQLTVNGGAFAGLAIGSITPGSPADEAGLKHSEDSWRQAIVGIDGEDIGTLHDYCEKMPESGKVTLSIFDRESSDVSEVELDLGRN